MTDAVGPPLHIPRNTALMQVAGVQMVSLPPDLPRDRTLAGQVVKAKDGQIVIRTEKGDIVLNGDLDLQPGQQVQVKLQAITSRAPQLILELPQQAAKADTPLLPKAVAIPVSRPDAPQTMQPAQAPAVQHAFPDQPRQTIQELAIKALPLPDRVTPGDLPVIVQRLISANGTKELPRVIAEGLAKLQTLTALLPRYEIMPPDDMVQDKESLPRQIVMQIAALKTKPDAVQKMLGALPMQTLPILQTVVPGMDIDMELKAQLIDVLAAYKNIAPIPSESFLPVTDAPVLQRPGFLTSFLEKVGLSAPPVQQPTPAQAQIHDMAALEKNILPLNDTGIEPDLPEQQAQAPFRQASVLPDKTVSMNARAPAIGLALDFVTQNTQTAVAKPAAMVMQSDGNVTLIWPQDTVQAAGKAQALLPGTVFVTMMERNAAPTSVLWPSVTETGGDLSLSLHPALGRDWPALDALWQTVQEQPVLQPVMLPLMQQTIPTPHPAHFPVAVLFFFAVLKGGVSPSWPGGEGMQNLEQAGKHALLNQLSRDIQALQSAFNDPVPAEAWRPLPMPLLVHEQLHRLQWHYRHQDDGAQDGQQDGMARKKRTRFLVDVPKTNLGDIQIDGMVQTKSLDVILRTESEIGDQARQALRQRYHTALEIAGFAGSLDFQAGRNHYVRA